MKIGYACKHQTIQPKNRTITFKKFNTLNKKEQIHTLYRLAENNLDSLENILLDNIKNNIKMFRITSALFPLTTHKEVVEWWDPVPLFQNKLEHIGNIIKENDIRVSLHPGQFTVLTSDNEQVINNAFNELLHNYNILKSLKLYYYPDIILHMGGKYGNMKQAIHNLIRNFNKLPDECKKMIRFENDQHIYGTQEVYHVCKFLNVPMVLDVTHHYHNSNNIDLDTAFYFFFDTWNNATPKIHLSSDSKDCSIHKHDDYININDFINILQYRKIRDFDVMLECKQTNIALQRLKNELKRNSIELYKTF